MFRGRSKAKVRLNIRLPEIQKSPYFDNIKHINILDSKTSTASNTPPTQEIQIQTDFPYQNSACNSIDKRTKSVAQINFPADDANFPSVSKKQNITEINLLMMRKKSLRSSVNTALQIILNKKIPNTSQKLEHYEFINKANTPKNNNFRNSKLRSQSIPRSKNFKLPILNGRDTTPIEKHFINKRHTKIIYNKEYYVGYLRKNKENSFSTTQTLHHKNFSFDYVIPN